MGEMDQSSGQLASIAWPLIEHGQTIGLRWDIEQDGRLLGHVERRHGADRLEVYDSEGRRLGHTWSIGRAVNMIEGRAEACG